MRYQEFNLTEDELFELKMSPTNLAKMAKNIDARVGMEFELIVPGAEGDEDEYESEPDYDMDEGFPTGPGWDRDVISFFRGGSMASSTREIQRAIDALNEDFYGWIGDQEEEFMSSDEGQARAREIAYDNIDKDAYDTEEELTRAVQDYIDNNEDRIRDQLIDEFRDDLDDKFVEWLEENDINSMSEFANEYSLDWPYWTESDYYGGGDGVSIDSVADDFSQAVGAPVNASRSYHGARREPGKWVVEPDGSLEADSGEAGLEFVSPPLTVPEMMASIDKVAKWAGRVGAYTNESTGLHMNVSVPNQDKLDFVKLAMFLGDNYILEQFGREGNTYCKSVLKKIVSSARTNPDRVEEMMRQFQGGLNQLASKLLHTGSTDKYSSINNRGGWVEFRSPGGDWLGDDLSAVKNTMLRAVVALDVATKPEEFKQEYYKKLYKTLNPRGDEDVIQYFARYAAGELPQSALKAFVRQIQTQRTVKKQKPGAEAGSPDMEFVWKVTGSASSPYQSAGTEVVATSAEGALAAAVRKWDLNIGNRSVAEFTNGWRAVPLRPATQAEIDRQAGPRDNRRDYWVYLEGDPERGVKVSAAGEYAAKQIANMEASRLFAAVTFEDIKVAILTTTDGTPLPGRIQDIARQVIATQSPQQGQGTPSRDQEFSGIWEVVSRNTDEVVYRFSSDGMTDPRSVAEAEAQAARWVNRSGFDDPVYVRPFVRQAGQSSRSVPGSTNDLARQRLAAQMPRHEPFDGNWEVYSIASNNVIYRFAANTEEEAVRAFNIWQDAVRNPSMPREGFNLRAVPVPGRTQPAQDQQQDFRVSYTITRGTETRNSSVNASGANANAAMNRVRTNLENSGYRVDRIEAEPVAAPAWRGQQTTAQGTGSLPPGNVRWLILDRNENEIYSFINTTAQSDANQYALNWITRTAPPEVRERGPFEVVPAR